MSIDFVHDRGRYAGRQAKVSVGIEMHQFFMNLQAVLHESAGTDDFLTPDPQARRNTPEFEKQGSRRQQQSEPAAPAMKRRPFSCDARRALTHTPIFLRTPLSREIAMRSPGAHVISAAFSPRNIRCAARGHTKSNFSPHTYLGIRSCGVAGTNNPFFGRYLQRTARCTCSPSVGLVQRRLEIEGAHSGACSQQCCRRSGSWVRA